MRMPAVAALLAGTLSVPGVLAGALASPAAAAPPAPGPPSCATPVVTWSLPQLAAQMLIVSGEFSALGTSAPEVEGGVGGLVLFGEPPAGSGPSITSGIAALQADATASGQVPPWMSTDEEGGTVTRLALVLGRMPSARQLASDSTSGIQATVEHQATGMRALGVTMDLAPVLDTAAPTDPVADESSRSFSETGKVAGADGLAFAHGLESAGVVPVVKHFPGLGHANADTDTGPATDPPLATLEQDDLVPFGEAAAAGLPVVMVGHPMVPGLTGGKPASLSPATYSLLRHTLGFTGVTMTDSLAAGAISAAGYTEASAAVAAVEAGADLAMVDASTWVGARSALEAAIGTPSLPLAQAQAAVSSILAAKGVPTCPTVGMATAAGGTGYWLADSGGGVAAYGSAAADGSMAGHHIVQPVVGMAADPATSGYWEVAADGGIFSFTAPFFGSMGGTRLNEPIVGMAAAPTGGGYWEVAADGGIFSFGTARFHGSMGGKPLNEPVVGMAAAPTGGGYWEVAADGGIFSFGTARFHGSMGGKPLNELVVGMSADPTTGGYWEVAADGGIFSFTAPFHGSMGGKPLNAPVVGMAAPTGGGYWEVATDGGIFSFGTARFFGSYG